MNARPITKALYVLNGVVFVLAGSAVLLFNTPLLTDGIREIILKIAHGDLNTLHLVQEFSALMVAVGILSFWMAKNYEQSTSFHTAMTVFWGLLAFIHWFDVRGPWHTIKGPIINTVPFVLYLLVAWIRSRDN